MPQINKIPVTLFCAAPKAGEHETFEIMRLAVANTFHCGTSVDNYAMIADENPGLPIIKVSNVLAWHIHRLMEQKQDGPLLEQIRTHEDGLISGTLLVNLLYQFLTREGYRPGDIKHLFLFGAPLNADQSEQLHLTFPQSRLVYLKKDQTDDRRVRDLTHSIFRRPHNVLILDRAESMSERITKLIHFSGLPIGTSIELLARCCAKGHPAYQRISKLDRHLQPQSKRSACLGFASHSAREPIRR